AEAIACGKPAITTGLGPAREFCPPEAAQFCSAKEIEIPSSQLQLGPMAGPYTWFEPDAAELARLMREAYERRNEPLPQLVAASAKVRRTLSWNEITRQQLERVRILTGLVETHPDPEPSRAETALKGAR
ncbi:MAG TPA: hypothetical protein VFZ08_07875, partial [Terriglobia bacterium]|nr:hypothetical protein [Terriglobia bacterium]